MQLKFCTRWEKVFADELVEEFHTDGKKHRYKKNNIRVSFYPCECKHFFSSPTKFNLD